MSQFDFQTVKAGDQPQNNMEGMVDIETLGVTAGCPVVTIGATLFDPYASDSSEEMLRRSILIRVDIADSIKYSNKDEISGETIRWWFEQDDKAIKALVKGAEPAVSMQEALNTLTNFFKERGSYVDKQFFDGLSALPRASRFWAKDPDFDMQLMRWYYEHPKLDGHSPWKFWECRSVRTMQDLAWPGGSADRPSFKVPGVAHDARWDSIQQAMTVQAAMRRLGLAKDQDVQYGAWEGVKKDES
jgi:hypothetical protein